MELASGGSSFDWFFLAMAHRQLGHKVEARTWYDKGVEGMEKNKSDSEELLRFRRAARLLGVTAGTDTRDDQTTSSDPQQSAKPDGP